MDVSGYIYLLQLRESVKLDENIYKIGRTKQDDPMVRIKAYPKGSKILLIKQCYDPINIERMILNIFKNKYIQYTDFGTEYFKGNSDNMADDIINIIKMNDVKHHIVGDTFVTDITSDGVETNIKNNVVEEITNFPVIVLNNKFNNQENILSLLDICYDTGNYKNIIHETDVNIRYDLKIWDVILKDSFKILRDINLDIKIIYNLKIFEEVFKTSGNSNLPHPIFLLHNFTKLFCVKIKELGKLRDNIDWIINTIKSVHYKCKICNNNYITFYDLLHHIETHQDVSINDNISNYMSEIEKYKMLYDTLIDVHIVGDELRYFCTYLLENKTDISKTSDDQVVKS